MLACLAASTGGRAQAQDGPVVVSGEAPPAGSLRGLVGVGAATSLLLSETLGDRVRGIERLGAIGTEAAIDALTAALEQGSALSRDAGARLTAVRVLAPHAAREAVRPILIREMTDAGEGGRGGDTPLGALTRSAAALALAKAGDRASLEALARALVQGGVAGKGAADALTTYPPSNLEPLLGPDKRPVPPALAALLGDLGDLRAITRLRAAMGQDEPTAQIAAAIALAKLGDAAPLPLARGWLAKPDPRLSLAASEVFVRLGAPEAGAAVARLFDSDATRTRGLELALRVPREALVPRLAALVPALSGDDRALAIAALGRAGGPRAAAALARMLATPALAMEAAHALAQSPGDDARSAIAAELSRTAKAPGAARRLAARAGVVRSLARGDAPAGLDDVLVALLASKDAADRAAGAFGLVATGARDASTLVTSTDEATSCAAARASITRGRDAMRASMPRLARAASSTEAPSPSAVAAGVALLADAGGGDIATSTLAAWAEGGGPLAPLAARALPSRDHEALRPRITRLLRGTDPLVRAHVALGLAASPEPDAVSLLVGAYRFEADPAVRRAVIRALGARAEVQRGATLAVARDLDPDAAVRALAGAALAGHARGTEAPAGTAVAWLALASSDPSAAPSALGGRALRLVRSDGVAAPVVADPDGVVIVAGLPPGALDVVLAPEPKARDSAAR